MVKISLVEKYIEDGRQLLNALDKDKVKAEAAFWFYYSESDDWRLMFALPLVGQKGPMEAYKKVQGVLSNLSPEPNLSLKDISVISMENELVKLLRLAVKCETDTVFEGNTINGIYIEKAYIYRMR